MVEVLRTNFSLWFWKFSKIIADFSDNYVAN